MKSLREIPAVFNHLSTNDTVTILCCRHQSRVHQYRVLPGADGKLSVQAEGGTLDPKYNNLNELVADYINKQEKNGLSFALKYPVSPERMDPETGTHSD